MSSVLGILNRLSPQWIKANGFSLPALRGVAPGTRQWHSLHIAGGLALVLSRHRQPTITAQFPNAQELHRKIVKASASFGPFDFEQSLTLLAYSEVRLHVDGQTRLSFLACIQHAYAPARAAEPAAFSFAVVEPANSQLTGETESLFGSGFNDTDSAWFNETQPAKPHETHTEKPRQNIANGA